MVNPMMVAHYRNVSWKLNAYSRLSLLFTMMVMMMMLTVITEPVDGAA